MRISDVAGQVKIERSTCQGRKLRPRGIPVKEGRILAEEAGTAHRGDNADGGSSGSPLGRRLVILRFLLRRSPNQWDLITPSL